MKNKLWAIINKVNGVVTIGYTRRDAWINASEIMGDKTDVIQRACGLKAVKATITWKADKKPKAKA